MFTRNDKFDAKDGEYSPQGITASLQIDSNDRTSRPHYGLIHQCESHVHCIFEYSFLI